MRPVHKLAVFKEVTNYCCALAYSRVKGGLPLLGECKISGSFRRRLVFMLTDTMMIDF